MIVFSCAFSEVRKAARISIQAWEGVISKPGTKKACKAVRGDKSKRKNIITILMSDENMEPWKHVSQYGLFRLVLPKVLLLQRA